MREVRFDDSFVARMFFKKTSLVCLFGLVLCGCSPSSLEDYQKEGKALCRSLTKELEQIHTREDLAKALPSLEKRFMHIVELTIEAKQFKESGVSEEIMLDSAKAASDELREQLSRIYQLEGGRELIEQAQREALFKLDAYERALMRKKYKRL